MKGLISCRDRSRQKGDTACRVPLSKYVLSILFVGPLDSDADYPASPKSHNRFLAAMKRALRNDN